MIRPWLLIFARPARIGRGKRRLAATVGDVAAWRFQRARLRDLIRRFGGAPQLRVVLLLEPHDPRGLRRLCEGRTLPTAAQARGGLSPRMRAAFHPARSPAGAGPALIMGADIPDADADTVLAAARLLGRAPVVFGPAPDGGFWIAGAAARARGRFGFLRAGRWSTAHALADARASVDPRDGVVETATLADVDDAPPQKTA